MGHVETGAYVEQIVPREIYVLAVGRHLVLSRPWAVRGVGDVISGGESPTAVTIHEKREVLDVVVSVERRERENHSPICLVDGRLSQTERAEVVLVREVELVVEVDVLDAPKAMHM
jgi:hypothetical protein